MVAESTRTTEDVAQSVPVDATQSGTTDSAALQHSPVGTSIQLPLTAINVDYSLQPRINKRNEQHVEALKETPGAWPPLTVVQDGASYLLIDGFHRLEAAQKLGLDAVSMRVVAAPADGGLRGLAFSLNSEHGLALTLADRKAHARYLLTEGGLANHSDREVANRCGLSDKTIAAIRDSLDAERADDAGAPSENPNLSDTADGESATAENPQLTDTAAGESAGSETVNLSGTTDGHAATAENPKLTTRIGRDGKTRPAHPGKGKRVTSAAQPAQAAVAEGGTATNSNKWLAVVQQWQRLCTQLADLSIGAPQDLAQRTIDTLGPTASRELVSIAREPTSAMSQVLDEVERQLSRNSTVETGITAEN